MGLTKTWNLLSKAKHFPLLLPVLFPGNLQSAASLPSSISPLCCHVRRTSPQAWTNPRHHQSRLRVRWRQRRCPKGPRWTPCPLQRYTTPPALEYCPSQLFQRSSVPTPSPITHYKLSQRLAGPSFTLIPLHRQLTGPGIYPTTRHARPSSTPGQPHRGWQQHLTNIDVGRSRHVRYSAVVKSPHGKTSASCQASFWFSASSVR